ncbi:MAG TPA: helix-turn-helix domain-containing protein [Pyrinomonadaceae bacterium]|jgi:DNA-binding NtrC family response regulator
MRALVIDDEPQVRRFVLDVLREDGWNIVEADTAERAFELLREAPSRGALASESAARSHEPEEWSSLAEVEGRYVARVLVHTDGNKQAASRLLGVDRKTLERMIKRHHI